MLLEQVYGELPSPSSCIIKGHETMFNSEEHVTRQKLHLPDPVGTIALQWSCASMSHQFACVFGSRDCRPNAVTAEAAINWYIAVQHECQRHAGWAVAVSNDNGKLFVESIRGSREEIDSTTVQRSILLRDLQATPGRTQALPFGRTAFDQWVDRGRVRSAPTSTPQGAPKRTWHEVMQSMQVLCGCPFAPASKSG
jgi:hypothetical protein